MQRDNFKFIDREILISDYMKFLFYRPLKVDAKEKEILFWSDTHFNHACLHWEVPLWKARGFDSVEEHNEGLIDRWNQVCSKDSIVFHLGDFIFGKESIQNFSNIVQNRLNFKALYSLPGNHYSGWKQIFESLNGNVWKINENKTVFFVPNYLEIYANGVPMVLSHYPLASFNGQAKGAIHLHGHCHSNLAKSELGPLIYKTKTLDVGVENCPFPVDFGYLKERFIHQPTLTYDHHDSKVLNPFG